MTLRSRLRWRGLVITAALLMTAFFAPSKALAELIVAYASAGSSGSLPATEVGAGVQGNVLSRGSGVFASTGTTYNSRGWDGNSLAAAQTNQDFLEWGFESTGAWDLEWLTVLYDRSSSGPSELAILLSIDDGMQWDNVFADSSVSANSDDLATVSLNHYQGVDRARFRLYAWGASSSSGTFDLENFTSLPPRAIELTGQTAAVPEPATTTLLASLPAAAYLAWRRRRRHPDSNTLVE